ncbi:MAG: metal-dependent hydrolase [Candidatus Riflebacteria bacterium]|nr:metal-dependent hydrolase [Candidatus Riflebacteria bacterium]
MDLITQGLLGGVVAQAACSEKIGRKSLLWGFMLGILPDFDILSGILGEWVSLKHHRGISHSLIILTLISVPAGLLCKRLSGSKAENMHWALLAFLSLFTHPIIDWFTSYGTCLFWPLSSQRFALDALSIIDPLFSLPLLIVFLAGSFNYFSPATIKQISITGLIFSSLYAYSGYINSQSTVTKAEKIFAERGFKAVDIRATPTFMNISIFRVVGKDLNDNFLVTYMNKVSKNPISEIIHFKADKDEYAQTALQHEHGQLFNWFSMNMILTRTIKKDDSTYQVVLNDMRYGLLTTPERTIFSAEANFNAAGNIIQILRRHQRGAFSEIKNEFKTLWKYL